MSKKSTPFRALDYIKDEETLRAYVAEAVAEERKTWSSAAWALGAAAVMVSFAVWYLYKVITLALT